jgi:DNA-binding HxlR family transcriptional regulator
VARQGSVELVATLFTPKRYSDLVDTLTGISTNLLAARLKHLEERGVVSRRRLPPPAASSVYELTERGRLLEPVLYALSRFGMHYLEPLDRRLSLDLETWLFGMRVAFKPTSAGGIDETYQFHIDGVPGHVVVQRGAFEAFPGEARSAAVTITTTTSVLLALTTRQLSPAQALSQRAVELHGDPTAFSRFVDMFELPPPDAVGRGVKERAESLRRAPAPSTRGGRGRRAGRRRRG